MTRLKKSLMLLMVCVVLLSGSAFAAGQKNIVIGTSQEPVTLDPQRNANTGGSRIVVNVFDRLLSVDENNQIIPNLAKSWEISGDGLTYTFHLRDDVKFHNGDPLTAHDVKYSVDTTCEVGYAADISRLIAGTNVVDDHTIEVFLASPSRLMLNYFAQSSYLSIVNSKLAKERGEDFSVNPRGAGTGPYEFVDWQAGVSVTLKANQGYHGGAPAIENVLFKIIPESSVGVIALETGDVDIFMDLHYVDVPHLQRNKDLQVDVRLGRTHYYICVNATEPPFDNVKVRQALAYAINLDDFVLAALNGIGGTKTGNVVFPDSFGYSENFPPREQDIEKAKELLAEAGYPNGLSFRMMTNDGIRKVSTETLQGMFVNAGIDVSIDLLETSAMGARLGVLGFEAVVMNQIIEYEDAGAEIVEKLASTSYGNFGKYVNPRIDELLKLGAEELDEEICKGYYAELQQILYDELPVIPLYYANVASAAKVGLKGFQAWGNGLIYVNKLSW